MQPIVVTGDEQDAMPFEAALAVCEATIRGDAMIGILPVAQMEAGARGLVHAGLAGRAEAWMALGEAYELRAFPRPIVWSSALELPEMEQLTALACFAEAATLGDARGVVRFARHCCDDAVSPATMRRALGLLEQLEAGGEWIDRDDIVVIGMLQYRLGEHERAFATHTRAAERGSPDAEFELHLLCEKGEGTPKDEAAAREHLERAAERGQPRAAYNIGAAYATGRAPYPKDVRKAVEYYTRAVKGGHALARVTLGVMLLRGDGVPRNRDGAILLFENAEIAGFDVDGYLADLGIERPR